MATHTATRRAVKRGEGRGAAILRGAEVRSSERIALGSVDTRLGRVWAAASERGLVAVSLPGDKGARFRERLARDVRGADCAEETSPLLARALRELDEFFLGSRTRFEVPLDLRVTPFVRSVLEALSRVPYGETRTYGSLAKAIGKPRAARAVGLALSKNPVPIVLACHRIVAGDGTLGGFAGKERALESKRSLLAHEKLGSGARPR